MAVDAPHQKQTKHGVDVEGYREFIGWVAENPEDAMIEFRASGIAEEAANRTTATISDWGLGGGDMGATREHTLKFGLPPELEEAMAYVEPTDRYEAIEGALAGLTACINGTVAYNALREGIQVDEVSTSVRAPVDLRMLFGILDVDKADEMYGDLEIDVDVTGKDLSEEDIKKVQEYYLRSPVYTLVTLGQPNEPNVMVHSS
jgi:uncharacterized OsmC-like protein